MQRREIKQAVTEAHKSEVMPWLRRADSHQLPAPADRSGAGVLSQGIRRTAAAGHLSDGEEPLPAIPSSTAGGVQAGGRKPACACLRRKHKEQVHQ